MKEKNMTRVLMEKYDFSYEQIAAEVSCSANAPRYWRKYGEKKMRRIYREALTRLFLKVTSKKTPAAS
jgi:hypothetical protein